jgi:hypothetical protein
MKMQIVEKQNRFGKYYKVNAILQVGALNFKVSNRTLDLSDMDKAWKLKRNQMVKMLKETCPDDWLFRGNWHFDAQTDGIIYDDEDYKVCNKELIDWIIEQLETFKSYRIRYYEETNHFDLISYTHSFDLKPSGKLLLNLVK